ncbi:MAG TPA: hypothetical protein VIQ02_00440, partial [Jiangellaceae bacterium]
MTVTVSGNNISLTDGPGIFALARGTSTATLDAHILNNTVAAPSATNAARAGIRVDSGSATSIDTTVNLEISGNVTAGSTNTATATTSPGINLRKQGTDPTINEFHIQGLSPSPTGTPNVENFVNSQNTSTSGTFGVGGTALLSAQTGFTTTGPFLLAADTNAASTVTTDSDPQPSDPDPIPPASTYSDSTPPPVAETEETAAFPNTSYSTPPAIEGPTGTVSVQLSQAELNAIVAAAVARWTATGLTTDQVAALHGMTFTVGNLSELNLGSFTPAQITFDADAAGRGWYLDATPGDDAEFGAVFATTRMQTTPTGAPAGHYDLLTAVMHEMGHTLGLGDSYLAGDRDDLMYGWLFTGERR